MTRDAMYDAIVSTAWEASYRDPLAERAGERVEATDRVEDWRATPGWTWRWCRDSGGHEGWTPEALLLMDGAEATLREDYDAHELTATVGARLSVERELAGWALCHTPEGVSGWIPLACLTRLPD